MIEAVLLRTGLATLAAFVGGALGVMWSRAAMRRLPLLVGLGLVALLWVTLTDALPDARAALSLPVFLLAVASGFVLFWLVSRSLAHVCPACSLPDFDPAEADRLQTNAVLLMAALAIHSTLDGVAVVLRDPASGHPGQAMLLAVSLHKLPEGLALALLLLGAGYSRRRALLWTWTIEATTLLGGLLGAFALRTATPAWLGVVFAHVGGGFLYLVLTTLLAVVHRRPRAKAAENSSLPA